VEVASAPSLGSRSAASAPAIGKKAMDEAISSFVAFIGFT
jgi:hypothetical protein